LLRADDELRTSIRPPLARRLIVGPNGIVVHVPEIEVSLDGANNRVPQATALEGSPSRSQWCSRPECDAEGPGIRPSVPGDDISRAYAKLRKAIIEITIGINIYGYVFVCSHELLSLIVTLVLQLRPPSMSRRCVYSEGPA